MSNPTMSLDDQAAHAAEQMFAKSGAAGDMPTERPGESGAEGGFTPDAGGEVIDQAGRPGSAVSKGGNGPKTGTAVTSEPGRQGDSPKTNGNVTSEPKGDTGLGGQPGEPGLDQDADEDDGHRKRKTGRVGVPDQEGDGGQPGEGKGGNLEQNADQQTRGRKGGQVGISKSKSKSKQDDYEDDMGDEEAEDDMEMSKADIDADTLMKSLDALEGVAQGSVVAAPEERRKALAEKLAAGDLNKSEMQELHALTAAAEDGGEEDELRKSEGGDDAEEALDDLPGDDALAKSLSEDETTKGGFEVSDFLERQSMMIAGAVDNMTKSLRGQFAQDRQHAARFNTALAKSMKGMAQLTVQQGKLIKSLTDRLEVVENQPVGRKGVTTGRAAVLAKSMTGEAGDGAQPSYSRTELMDGLEQMAKSMDAVGGIRITDAMAMLESSGDIPKSVLNEVVAFRKNNGGMVRVA